MKIITAEILKSWGACEEGYIRFTELFPNGGTLQECLDAITEKCPPNWGIWLFDKCKNSKIFEDQTYKGYRNSGNWNSGNWNSGDMNSGDVLYRIRTNFVPCLYS